MEVKMRWTIALILSGALGLAACAVNDMPEANEGRILFTENCAQCHGAGAKGGGEFWASELGRAPPDLTTLYARGFDRTKVLSMIDGYTRAPFEDHEMPEFGLLLRGETVPVEVDEMMTPVPRPLAALLAYLESVQE
jgi:mono/diheme cytochrome c family protein